MTYLALILLVLAFLKSFYYGIFEIKVKKNKPGGIAVCFLAILRPYFSCYFAFFIIYYLANLISAYFDLSNFSLYFTSSNNAGICSLKYKSKGIIVC